MQLTRDLFAIAKFLFSYAPGISVIKCTYWPCDINFWPLNPKTLPLGYPKVIPYTKFEHFGIIRLWVNPNSHRARQRASTHVYTRRRASTRQIKLILKIVSIHTDRVDACRCASSLELDANLV